MRMFGRRNLIRHAVVKIRKRVFDGIETKLAKFEKVRRAMAHLIEFFGVAAFNLGGVLLAPPMLNLYPALGVGFIVRPDFLKTKAVFLYQGVLGKLLHAAAADLLP